VSIDKHSAGAGPAKPLIEAALEAGKTIREHYRTDRVEVRDRKSRADYVTNVDLMVQEEICRMIKPVFPGVTIIAEESAAEEAQPSETPREVIILDPLDGTLNFMHGYNEVAISMGYWKNNRPFAGVVYNPIAEDLFYATAGQGAFRNGKSIRPSSNRTLGECVLATGWPYDRSQYDRAFDVLSLSARACQEVRIAGSAALNICYVASGVFDAYWEWDLHSWDMAGGAVIALEAGCTLTSLDGSPFEKEGHEIVVSNRHIHDEMLKVLTRGRKTD